MKIIVYSIKYNTLTKTKINSYYDAAIKRSKEILNFNYVNDILSFNSTLENKGISIKLEGISKVKTIYELSENTFFIIYEC